MTISHRQINIFCNYGSVMPVILSEVLITPHKPQPAAMIKVLGTVNERVVARQPPHNTTTLLFVVLLIMDIICNFVHWVPAYYDMKLHACTIVFVSTVVVWQCSVVAGCVLVLCSAPSVPQPVVQSWRSAY